MSKLKLLKCNSISRIQTERTKENLFRWVKDLPPHFQTKRLNGPLAFRFPGSFIFWTGPGRIPPLRRRLGLKRTELLKKEKRKEHATLVVRTVCDSEYSSSI
jgi:hypothetical protein